MNMRCVEVTNWPRSRLRDYEHCLYDEKNALLPAMRWPMLAQGSLAPSTPSQMDGKVQ